MTGFYSLLQQMPNLLHRATKDIPSCDLQPLLILWCWFSQEIEQPEGNVTGTSDPHPKAIKNTI